MFENLLLRQQLAVALRARPRPRLRWRDRMFWVLARRLCADWRSHLVLVRPETLLRWHRQSWREFWWWRSRRPKGRPRLPKQVRDLIHRLSEENRLWGTERIRGELLKLGITVSNGSIRRYRWRPAPRPPSQTWATFLRSHAHAIWAADLFTIQTVAFRTLYVLFFIVHGRRELVHLAVTAHPTAAWVWQQLIEATPWRRKPAYLIRDRDRVYGGDLVPRAKAIGIQTLLTPFRAPRANAIAERVDPDPPHRVPRPRARPQRAAPGGRPHRVRGVLQRRPAAPQPGLAPPLPATGGPRASSGPVVARPVLGGLHHVYARAA